MSKARIADLHARLQTPKKYDVTSEQAARREANRAKYPQVTLAVDYFRSHGFSIDKVENVVVTK